MRMMILCLCLVVSACAPGSRSGSGPVRPQVSSLAVVVEGAPVALSDSLVRATASSSISVVPASDLARVSDPIRWQRLAITAPEVDAILTIAPAFEPERGRAWNEGSTAPVEIKRSWRRFSATLIGRDSGRKLWSETFSNGPPQGGALPTPDLGRAVRIVFAELRSTGLVQ